MVNDKFVLGIDFGTESGRAVLFRVRNGEECASVIVPYRDGVIDQRLPNGPRLERDWALQNPRDWLFVLRRAIPGVLKAANLKSDHIVAVGIDCTASTPLPTTGGGTPLCFVSRYTKHPHAWPKLWKHHAAQPQADRINEIGHERGEEFVRVCGKYSSESFLSKVLQVLDEAPQIFTAAERFIEGADWIVWQLLGEEKRGVGTESAALKEPSGPSLDFLCALHPGLEHVLNKLHSTLWPLGTQAGGLTAYWAHKTGLREGIPVAIGNVDSHAAVPACGVTKPGSLVMIMGTSVCHWLLGQELRVVKGMRRPVRDGIIAGLWGYEAGQSAVGDLFAWFFEHGVPKSVYCEAERREIPFQLLLEQQAGALQPGESGLLALDWWNGNRSVLVDSDLTGMLLGITLATRPAEIYRALMESTAFGTRQILAAFEGSGFTVNDLVACGGLPEKNKLLMQIYADVTGREIRIAKRPRMCSALGAAMYGAVAAGRPKGGYDSISEAAEHMAHVQKLIYRPRRKRTKIYDQLFGEYQVLHDYFGRGINEVMKRLKGLRS